MLDTPDPRAASIEVVIGGAVEEINARAAAVSADVIVLGWHRSRGEFDDLLGTTADRIIRTSAVPCLLANAELRWPPSRVLIPTDFSVPARHAVGMGIDWLVGLFRDAPPAKPCDVQILHVNAFSAPSYRPLNVERPLGEEVNRARERASDALHLSARIVHEPSADAGIRRVAAEGTDLVILGTHGYNWLGRALIGSVASAVARTLDHPILLVPPER